MIMRKSHTKSPKEIKVSLAKKISRRFLSDLEEIREEQKCRMSIVRSSSGIAVDVQQRLNCALPSFSLSSDSLSRFEVFTAYPQMIN
jgi:hypothetical protein